MVHAVDEPVEGEPAAIEAASANHADQTPDTPAVERLGTENDETTDDNGQPDAEPEVVLRHTRDGLSGRTLRLFDVLVGKPDKTYYEELRDDSTVFTKADISDSGIATGIKDLIRDLQSIEAPYIVEWSKGDKWVRLDEKPRV